MEEAFDTVSNKLNQFTLITMKMTTLLLYKL
jgi:hypothetical protein